MTHQGSDYDEAIMKPIRKAVFPVAGLGTRFLPATKAMPKEMLPVVDRPLIQHVVDEAREAGIEHFIFVTGRNKAVIEDHFDRQFELEHDAHASASRRADLELLAHDLPGPGTASFTRQQSPLGLGHAVWCARELVGPRAVRACCLPDVLVQHERSCLAQMIDAARDLGDNANVIAVEEVPPDRMHMYGVVGVGETQGRAVRDHRRWWRNRRASKAPSNLIITGRYILQPDIFDILAAQKRGAGGEIQLTDAMIELAKTQPFYGLNSTAGASIAAPSSASSPPISPTRSTATISRPHCGPSSSACWARASRRGWPPVMALVNDAEADILSPLSAGGAQVA